jgi:hypothetical protein
VSNILIRPIRPVPPGDVPTVAWTQQSIAADANKPAFNSFTALRYDPLNGRILIYAIPATQSGIYSTTLFQYITLTNTWTILGGTPGVSNGSNWSPNPPGPGDRHPVQQTAIDSTRNRLWLLNGVYQSVDRGDFWYWDLDTDVWVSVGGTVPTITRDGALIYSPDDDVLMLFGQRNPTGFWETWVYAPSASLSAEQTAAGCSAPQTWTELTPTGMPSSAYSYFPNAIYDPDIAKVIITGGFSYVGGSGRSEGIKAVWEYDIPSKTWTTLSPSNMPTESAGQTPEQFITRIGSGSWEGRYIYHQTGHKAAVAGAADYLYHAGTRTFTALLATGTGPERVVYLTWDATADRIVAWSLSASSTLNIWHGVLS